MPKHTPMSDGPLCGRASPMPPRLVAGALLGLLLFRFLTRSAGGEFAAWLEAGAMLVLGACLWWVAKRQVGIPGASAALGLFVSAPMVTPHDPAVFGALGLFGMVYTGVGVAHALQGPRHKWAPRIALMAALTAFTAVFSPVACAAGLLLAATAMLYLAEGRRSLLPAIVALWVVTAALTTVSLHLVTGAPWTLNARRDLSVDAWHQAGLAVALLAALAFWAKARPTRYFGNSAPLLAALLLSALSVVIGAQCVLWALPFALLFAAGCFADAWDTRAGHVWAAGALLVCIWQFCASF